MNNIRYSKYKQNLFKLNVIKKENDKTGLYLMCSYNDIIFTVNYSINKENSYFDYDDMTYVESVSSNIKNSMLNTYGYGGSEGISYWDTQHFNNIKVNELIILFEQEIYKILYNYIINADCVEKYQQSLKLLIYAINDKQ